MSSLIPCLSVGICFSFFIFTYFGENILNLIKKFLKTFIFHFESKNLAQWYTVALQTKIIVGDVKAKGSSACSARVILASECSVFTKRNYDHHL